jgi:hypothetical protein
VTANVDCAECLAGAAAWPARISDLIARDSETLARSGRFEETFEWRIGTETTRGIERVEGGFRVWSANDYTWEAVLAGENEAFAACYVLSRLQQSLFYAIGWASWASATQLDEDDPARPWSPSPRNECERYLAQLWMEGRDRARSIAEKARPRIENGESWQGGSSTLGPTPDPPDGGPATWVETQTESSAIRFSSHSPTVTRAAEFIPVYEGLANDIPRELGWQTAGHFLEGML